MRRAFLFALLGLSLCAGPLWAPLVLGAQDLSFEQALDLAGQRSEILVLGRSALRRADLSLAEARSRFGPELSFQAGGGYLAHPPQTITVQAGELAKVPLIPPVALTFPEDKPSGYFELSLQLSQPLYTWGKLNSSVQLAALGLEASRADFAEQKRQLQRDLHTAYFSGVLAKDSASLLEQILDILQGIEQDRNQAFELGSANRLSLLQIQTQVSEVKRWLVQAREAYSSAREAVALYTDLDPQSLVLKTRFRSELLPFSEAELKEKAEGNSPTLKKARLEQEQARANLELIRSGGTFRPDVYFNLSVEVSGQTLPWSEVGREDTWELNLIAGVGAQGSLFDSGRSRHQLRQAEEAVAASQVAVDLVRKQIHLQTRQAVEALRWRQAEFQEAAVAVAQAEEEVKNASRAFEQQLSTREQWGEARIAMLQKKLVLLENEYSFELALHALESLAGFR